MKPENSPEKTMEHSSEPWSVNIINGRPYVESSGHLILEISGAQTGLAEDNANATRIVACVNFCAGVPTADLEPPWEQLRHILSEKARLNQREKDDQDTITSLRQQLAAAKPAIDFCAGSDLKTELEFGPKTYREAVTLLRSELAKEKQRVIFDQDAADKLSRCGAEVEFLKAELAKHVCPTCEKAEDNSICSDSWHRELAKNKAAREWIDKYGTSVAPIIDSKIGFWAEAFSELRALIQPEETPKCKRCGDKGHYSDQSSNGENAICECQRIQPKEKKERE